jgi:hypothetical protein
MSLSTYYITEQSGLQSLCRYLVRGKARAVDASLASSSHSLAVTYPSGCCVDSFGRKRYHEASYVFISSSKAFSLFKV